MKTRLLILTLLISIFSCQKKQAFNPEDPKDAVVQNLDEITTFSAGDGEWDVLGYGYNVTMEYGSSNSATYKVMDVEKLKREHPSLVESFGNETATPSFIVGENVQDFSSKLTGDVSLSFGTNYIFKGTIDANFEDDNKWYERYLYATYTNTIVKRRLKMVVDYSLLRKYLDADFANYSRTLTPQQLVEIYGTHVLVNIQVGGKIQAYYRAETTTKERTQAGGAGVKTAFVKLFNTTSNIDYTETEMEGNFNQVAKIKTIGGDAAQAVLGTGTFSYGKGAPPVTTNFNFDRWQAGVTDGNAELVNIDPNGLIPLYELISDPAKSQKVKDYTRTYLGERQVNMHSEPPVFLPVFWETRAVLLNMNHVPTGSIATHELPILTSDGTNTIYSNSRNYKIVMQGDGNLVLYKVSNGQALWASNTNSRDTGWRYRLYFQKDANLVINRWKPGISEQLVWASSTEARAGTQGSVNAYRAYLMMQDDGNFCMYYNASNGQYSLQYDTATQGGRVSFRFGRMK